MQDTWPAVNSLDGACYAPNPITLTGVHSMVQARTKRHENQHLVVSAMFEASAACQL
jgi:hypothetical protein